MIARKCFRKRIACTESIGSCKLMPHWRDCRDMLNYLPVRNEHWRY